MGMRGTIVHSFNRSSRTCISVRINSRACSLVLNGPNDSTGYPRAVCVVTTHCNVMLCSRNYGRQKARSLSASGRRVCYLSVMGYAATLSDCTGLPALRGLRFTLPPTSVLMIRCSASIKRGGASAGVCIGPMGAPSFMPAASMRAN